MVFEPQHLSEIDLEEHPINPLSQEDVFIYNVFINDFKIFGRAGAVKKLITVGGRENQMYCTYPNFRTTPTLKKTYKR